MRPRIRELDDGTLVAYLAADGSLTTEARAALAVITRPDGRREVAVKGGAARQPGRDGPSTIREG